MKTNLEIRHDKDDQMWYVYDKTDDNHEYIFDYFSDVSRWVESGGYFDRLMIFDAQTTEDEVVCSKTELTLKKKEAK